MFGRALTSVLWGAIADRYGRKPVIIFGIITLLVVLDVSFFIQLFISEILHIWYRNLLMYLLLRFWPSPFITGLFSTHSSGSAQAFGWQFL